MIASDNEEMRRHHKEEVEAHTLEQNIARDRQSVRCRRLRFRNIEGFILLGSSDLEVRFGARGEERLAQHCVSATRVAKS